MRLLLINPNTTEAITAEVAAAARAAASPGIDIVAVTGRFGARYIASRAAAAVAAHAALDAFAQVSEPCDAIVLACFGDPGLEALREITDRPVVGMAEASIHAACQIGRRFGIVTGGERWIAMLEEFVAQRGLRARLAGVRAVRQTGGAIAADPDAALDALAQACLGSVREDGADVVILGGAGLAGLAPSIRASANVPLIDCVTAAVRQAEAIAALGLGGPPASGAMAESIGLSPALARRLP